MNVKGNTQITGALLATIDEEGNDLKQLDFSTGSLNFTDLRNIRQNSQTNAGVSANFGVGEGKTENPREGQPTAEGANGKTLYANTSNLTYSNTQENSADKTLATLGHGNVTVGGTQLEQDGELTDAGKANGSPLILLNRDTSNTTKELWNSEQSQTVDATLDHRLLTEDGRAEIKQQAEDMPENIQKIAQNVPAPTGGNAVENKIGEWLNKLSDWTGGILPSDANAGGIVAQLPVLLGADDIKAGAIQIRDANDPYVLANPELFIDAAQLPYADTLEEPGKKQLEGKVVSIGFTEINWESSTYQNHTNGILNNLPQALVNGMEQTGSTTLTEFYNPTHGILGDLLESGMDKFAGNQYIHSGTARQAGEFVFDVISARADYAPTNIVGHSQGTLLLNAGLNTLDKSDIFQFDFNGGNYKNAPTFFINGAAVNANTMKNSARDLGFTFSGSDANKNDFVAEFLGRNEGTYVPELNIGNGKSMPLLDSLGSITNLPKIFGEKYPVIDPVTGKQTNETSPHSTYKCLVNCGDKLLINEVKVPDITLSELKKMPRRQIIL